MSIPSRRAGLQTRVILRGEPGDGANALLADDAGHVMEILGHNIDAHDARAHGQGEDHGGEGGFVRRRAIAGEDEGLYVGDGEGCVGCGREEWIAVFGIYDLGVLESRCNARVRDGQCVAVGAVDLDVTAVDGDAGCVEALRLCEVCDDLAGSLGADGDGGRVETDGGARRGCRCKVRWEGCRDDGA